jgi:hypothetical protein
MEGRRRLQGKKPRVHGSWDAFRCVRNDEIFSLNEEKERFLVEYRSCKCSFFLQKLLRPNFVAVATNFKFRMLFFYCSVGLKFIFATYRSKTVASG